MFSKSSIVSLAAALAVVGPAAAGEPEPPKIISWSNTKTANHKTAFQVASGERITFGVKAEGAETYRWEVDKVVQRGSGAASFKWVVPNKKGLWKIQVVTTNGQQEQYVSDLLEDFRKHHKKDMSEAIKGGYYIKDGYYPPQCKKEWILSTFLKEVKPGESIAKAVEAVPPEGGIVELLPGAHKVSETIEFSKSNIVIHGTHHSEICSGDPKKCIFLLNKNWENNPHLENVTFKGFKVTTTYGKNNRNAVIKGTKMKDLCVEGIHACSIKFLLAHALADHTGSAYNSNQTSYGVRISNNTLENCSVSAFFTHDADVSYNTIDGFTFDYGLKLATGGCKYVSIHDNHIKQAAGGRGACIQTESFGAHVFNNTCIGGLMGVTARYCCRHSRIKHNLITGAAYAGIQFYNQTGLANMLVANNRILSCGKGIIIEEPHWSKNRAPYDVTVINNVICNSGGDGICRGERLTTPSVTAKITNNIIANNGGYGINLAGEPITETHSYNNIWNNKKGNYKQAKPGAGDISVDPLFVDPSKGDFHLKSKAGRWDPKAKKWVKDKVQSRCIDAGDPKADHSREPTPNGGRVNIGAYGNMKEASKSAAH